MKKGWLALAAMAMILGSGSLVSAHHGPKEVVLQAKMGNVTFPHAKHQDELTIDCKTCHHTGTETPKCTACHGVKAEAPAVKDAFHTLCQGCHKEKGGPTGCKGCHQK